MSRLPTIATTSEIIAPREISWNALIAVKHGDFTFTRYGLRPPSLTM
jgi:hypothetical protein